ncbi:MAG: peptidylprolyl isomerase [Candidatus Berkelbacteria bacterium]|nr:peptidylprolyl isomerase [Candidatus Berkelbacteria bacterium]
MKKLIYLVIVIIAIVLLIIFWPKRVQGPASTTNDAVTTQDTSTATNNQNTNEEDKLTTYKSPGILPDSEIKDKKAVIVTAKGTIEIELYADKAPLTVSNFVYLASNGFYDGLTFHRVESNFVVQGGDPNGNGTGGPGYKFNDEPVVGNYLAGTVAMANSGVNTNGSQFFICLSDQPSLPKSYNLFGQVVSGMDVVKQIAVGDKMTSITIVAK